MAPRTRTDIELSPDLDDGLVSVVVIDRDGGGGGGDRLVESLRESSARVEVLRRAVVPGSPDENGVLHDGLPSAVNDALSSVRGSRVVIVDGRDQLDAPVVLTLADEVSGGVCVVQAVVDAPDGTVSSAGAVLVRPGALPWSLLRGHPREDAHGLRHRLFAADTLPLALRTAAATAVPALENESLALVAWTRAVMDADGGGGLGVDVGRVRSKGGADRIVDEAEVRTVTSWRDRAPEAVDVPGLEIEASGGLAGGLPVPPFGLRVPVPALVTVRRPEQLRWAVKTAAPSGPEGDGWGDTVFAEGLAQALRRLGQIVVVDRREAAVRPWSDHLDDVSLVLRGLDRVPPNPAATSLLWVISHPDMVTDQEVLAYDGVLAASRGWAARTALRTGAAVEPLLQATAITTAPPAAEIAGDPRAVFVGGSRGVDRPVLRAALDADVAVAVWGPGWDGIVPARHLRGTHLDPDTVPSVYAAAPVVLNDHWPDMLREGFVSNRVFDVVAAGGLVLTDGLGGLEDVFGGSVREVGESSDVAGLLGDAALWPSPEARLHTAERVRTEHSFDRRAAALVELATRLRVSAESPSGHVP